MVRFWVKLESLFYRKNSKPTIRCFLSDILCSVFIFEHSYLSGIFIPSSLVQFRRLNMPPANFASGIISRIPIVWRTARPQYFSIHLPCCNVSMIFTSPIAGHSSDDEHEITIEIASSGKSIFKHQYARKSWQHSN